MGHLDRSGVRREGVEGKGAAEKRKDERVEADRREISDSNVFRWTAARLVVLISNCNCWSMPLAGCREEGKKSKQKKRKKKIEKKNQEKKRGRKKPYVGITPPVRLVVGWNGKSGDVIMEPRW